MNDQTSPIVFRPSVLQSRRDPKTRLFRPNAAPVLTEGRLIRDRSMPARDWRRYDSPSIDRIDPRTYCASDFAERCALRYLRQAG